MKLPFNVACIVMAVVFLAWGEAVPAVGDDAHDVNPVSVKAYLSHETVRPGESFQLAVVATIQPGFHINSHEPTETFLVPTAVTLDHTPGIAFGPPTYPIPQIKAFAFSSKKLAVYEGKVTIVARGTISPDAAQDAMKVSGHLSYQACDEKACFMPQSAVFETPIRIVHKEGPSKRINQAVFEPAVPLTSDERQAEQIIKRGFAYAVAAFFLFGLALNLTPCVYPVIPMTVSFFGSQGKQRRGRVFALASYYVVGIAVVFSILGLVSSLAGRQWGFLFQSPWFVVFISLIILSMAASMFGAFEITVPAPLMTFGSKSRQGAVGSFLMGLTAGVIIAPCAAGIIVGLVGVVAKLGMVARGTLLFFVMGLGLGLPYLLLATFSGFMNRLPKSGMWMVWIRKVFGFILIGVALYFLIPQGKQAHDQQGFYLGVLGILGGLLLGFLDRGEGYNRTFQIIRVACGCLLILAAATLVHRSLQKVSPPITWIHYEGQSLEQLLTAKKPVLADFYADWCAACKELDEETFSDGGVIDRSKHFVMVRVDCTVVNPASSALMKRFKISGLPTLVFIRPDGKESKGLRVSGFVGPAQLATRMDKALAGL